MSLKRTVQYWRIGFIAISIMILLSVPGCGARAQLLSS